MTGGGGRTGAPPRSPRREPNANRARPDEPAGRVRANEGDECRCFCGSLLARRTPEGVELKCRRCKRILLVPIPGPDGREGAAEEVVENSRGADAPVARLSSLSPGARGQ
jgi:hypothetical protein